LKNTALNTTRHISFRVNDRWIFLFIYPIIALLSVHIGNDNTFRELLKIPSYYTDLLLALLCVYGLGIYYRWFFYKVEQKFDWELQLQSRIIHQLIYGQILPMACIIGLEVLYLKFILEIPLHESSVFYLELPVVGIFCILLQLLYSILYYRRHHLELKGVIELQKDKISFIESKDYKKGFIVNSGTRTLPIHEEKVAYFIILEKSTFLVTSDNKRYIMNSSIDKIVKTLNPSRFFQLNRQIVINRNNILSYSHTDTRKLEIEVLPEPGEHVYVSKTRASQFIKWLNQG
jgi:hypothetical protein